MQTRSWVIGGAAVALVAVAAIVRLQPVSVRSAVAPLPPLAQDPPSIGGPPRTRTSLPNAAVPSASGALVTGVPPRTPATSSSRQSPAVLARRATRERADAIREQLDERRRGAQNVPAVAAPLAPAATEEGARRRREFLQKAVREQYIPVAKSCYEELLARSPGAAGKVVLYFSIVGDEDTGGVVDHVETRDGTSFDDPEFLLCMRESMYSTLFDPPPNGAETTVEYPLELSP
jgi:hypothetical protein